MDATTQAVFQEALAVAILKWMGDKNREHALRAFPFLTDIFERTKKQAEIEEKKEPPAHLKENELLLNLLDEYKKEQEQTEQAKNTPSTIFCMNCGKKLPSTAQFCYSCGTKITLPEGE